MKTSEAAAMLARLRADSMTAEERSAIASKAGKARWRLARERVQDGTKTGTRKARKSIS